MKRKVVLATVLSTLVLLTGCGGQAPAAQSQDTSKTAEAEVTTAKEETKTEEKQEAPVEEETVEVEEPVEELEEEPVDEEVEEEYEDDGLEGQMLTPGNISALAGTWYETDVLDSRTLFINEDGSFSLEYRGGGALYGEIVIEAEETPDGDENYWYSFYDQTGELWDAVAIDEEAEYPLTDLYFGQGGDPHFISEESLGMKPGYLYVSSGNGATLDDFIGTWQCDRASITVTEGADGILVQIAWGNTADDTAEWEYFCTFDDTQEALVSEDETVSFVLNYGLLYWFDSVDDNGAGLEFEKIQ